MNLKEIRISIINRIIDFCALNGKTDEIMAAIHNKENLAHFLESDAKTYLCISRYTNIYSTEKDEIFEDKLLYYQQAFILYQEYLCYFLDAAIILPCGDYKIQWMKRSKCLLNELGQIDYTPFLYTEEEEIKKV